MRAAAVLAAPVQKTRPPIITNAVHGQLPICEKVPTVLHKFAPDS
eukprot:CAMPEP_0195042218 /NCGR_PEP_ID=MMETSP0347-20130606/2216_1 /TAXON_ID=2932 /ORGANISM="Alexandrium fundyense, Strain CCMP1719" /LENGTH=44 /DNA_ID= /DNA_START= /DNA_END= /DNA_ORIENTATION=